MNTCQTLLAWLKTNFDFGSSAGWFSAVVALGVLVFTVYWAIRQMRIRYLTEEWVKTVEFLFDKSEYLDPAINENYETSHLKNKKIEYQLVARRSIAYVDDLYYLKMGKHLKSWLSGSVELFIKPHEQWFFDHTQSYSPEFVCFVKQELAKAEK